MIEVKELEIDIKEVLKNTDKTKFELEKIYKDYEKVRLEGLYNMFDPRARILTGLTIEEYAIAIKYYTELKKEFGGKK